MAESPVNSLIDAARQEVRNKVLRDRKNRSPEVVRVLETIAKEFFDPSFNVDHLLRSGIVDWRIRKKFRAELEMGLKTYLKELRKSAATWLLIKTDLPVKEIACGLGYSAQRAYNFSRDFKMWTAESPDHYRAARRRRSQAGGGWLESVVGEARREKPSKVALPRGLLVCLDGDEEMARIVWAVLREETPRRQIELLEFEIFFGGVDLFELLSRVSREVGRRDRQQGVRMAEVALAAVHGSRALLGKAYAHLHSLALARLSNALRVAGDLPAAEETLEGVVMPWEAPRTRWEKRVEAEILTIKGSVRLFQRRYAEARNLLGSAIELAEGIDDLTWQVNARLQRAALARYEGRPAATIPDLRAVTALLARQEEPDPLVVLGVCQDSAVAYLEMGEIGRAEAELDRAKSLCEELGCTVIRHQLQWIEGMIAQERKEPRQAERLFRQARAGFNDVGDNVSGAIAALEIAILCQDQGRSAEVVGLLTTAVIPVLETIDLRPEALGALTLLRKVALDNHLPVGVLERAHTALFTVPHRLPGTKKLGPPQADPIPRDRDQSSGSPSSQSIKA